jgi:hypothetical protein
MTVKRHVESVRHVQALTVRADYSLTITAARWCMLLKYIQQEKNRHTTGTMI